MYVRVHGHSLIDRNGLVIEMGVFIELVLVGFLDAQ
jgi:hypothetical protein